MRLTEHFDDFFKDTVNLNPDRIETLEERVGAIERFIRNSDYGAPILSFSNQGSWAHGTIIRPPEGKEYDADLVAYVYKVEGWTPRDYILKLRRVLRESDRYRDKVRLKTRCVTIDYAGDFHLDVVPIVVTSGFPSNDATYWVCNRDDDAFEQTDGGGYAEWWQGRNAITNGHLKRVTRLLKYLRDIKKTFAVKSVLLTTLIGEQVNAVDELFPGPFADVPTALKTIVGRLDGWLPDDMPEVENPALPGESFTRNWNQDEYDTFREKIHDYREWIDDAYNEADRDESVRKWRRVFGDEFAKGETVERATSVVSKIAESLERGQDLVAVIIAYGRGVLARMPEAFPHVELPRWRRGKVDIPVRVVAHEKETRGGVRVRDFENGGLIDRGSGIEFQARQANGLPFPNTYEVQWQVVNTDRAARDANCLRGDFYRSNTHGCRYEPTKYRGAHWVRGFLINKRTGRYDGMSDRFFVVIR